MKLKGSLLVVDDEPALLEILTETLGPLVDRIYTASRGDEALEVLRREQVDCIVSDYDMPTMNGVQMLQRLRDAGNATPFIFYSGSANYRLMVEAAMLGAFDFLEKPNQEGLEEAVVRGLLKTRAAA